MVISTIAVSTRFYPDFLKSGLNLNTPFGKHQTHQERIKTRKYAAILSHVFDVSDFTSQLLSIS